MLVGWGGWGCKGAVTRTQRCWWGGVGGAIRVQSQGHNKGVGGVGWVEQ